MALMNKAMNVTQTNIVPFLFKYNMYAIEIINKESILKTPEQPIFYDII